MTDEEIADRIGPMFAKIAADGDLALKALSLPDGAAVLDVGTGAGNFAIFLGSRGFDVLTGEPSTDQTHYAGQDWAANAEQAGLADKIRFKPFDAGAMPFGDGAFAGAFFFGVLHHIDEDIRNAVLAEAVRVTGGTGAVVFFEPRAELLEKLWETDPGHPLAADPSAYLEGLNVRTERLQGAMMDITIVRAA